MGLLGTIQQSSAALQTSQIGLQVVGNNIANANTPGYIRQSLELVPAEAVRDGNLIKGHGVRAIGITQAVDKALAERMFAAQTAMSGGETLDKAYSQLEELTTDLDNSGLNQQLSLFNNALLELAGQPNDSSLRDFVILQGDTLATNLKRTREEVIDRKESWNGDLDNIATEINRLIERIARLNLQIATIEGGGLVHSDAAGLRDQRLQDLEELSSYVSINIQEQESGSVAVFVGGDFLVSNGIHREVYTAYDNDAGGNEVRIIQTDSPLEVTGGTLAATVQARDEIFGGFIDNVDEIGTALIRAVNEVHAQGQGRKGYSEIISANVGEPGVPLADAGLPWVPENGTFDINLVDVDGLVISNHRINVRRLGQVTDSTLNSIAADIDAINGISASVSSSGRLEITSDSPTAQITFADDTSDFLAAMGINTFFVGRSTVDIAVNPLLQENADYLAVSRTGIGEDTDVLTDMIDLVDRPLDHLGGGSVRKTYEDAVAVLGQQINLQTSATEGLRNFYATLQSQHLAITGVNIDEESIRMIAYQRSFQASSRVISTASEMLEILVAL